MISEPFALFEDTLGEGGALLFRGECEHVSCCEPDGLHAFFHVLESATRAGRWVLMAADFEAGYWFEPRLLPLVAREAKPRLLAWIFPSQATLSRKEADDFIAGELARLTEYDRVAGVAHRNQD